MQCILMDVEGTTTSIHFVHDILFPFSKDNLISFLEEEFNNKTNTEIQLALQEVAKVGLEEKLYSGQFSQEIALRVLIHMIKNDMKIKGLKTIQGFQWQKGYEQGKIIGHVYPDVPECLQEWKEKGLKLGIYSSGSVHAQKLLFNHTKYGNLQDLFDYNFDTEVGHKREVNSYKEIQKKINLPSDQILFLSDIPEELEAAKLAGFKVLQLVRAGTKPSPDFTGIRDFTEVEDVLGE
jgi:enolase-phosphatase E1